MFTDLDLPKLQSEDVATNFPGMTEAFLRLYTAYQEEQLALAERDAETPRGGDGNARRTDAVAEARRFRTARRNSLDRKRGVQGKRVAVSVDLGGRRIVTRRIRTCITVQNAHLYTK